MAMIKILLIFIFSLSAMANTSTAVGRLFKNKKYEEIVRTYYNKQSISKMSKKELLLISHSLHLLKEDRKNNILIQYILKKFHKKENLEIQRKIKNKETVDAEDFSKSLPILYWQLLQNYSTTILKVKKIDKLKESDVSEFRRLHALLSELEFREGRVEKTNNQVQTHIQMLKDKVYHFAWSLNLQYVSWQYDATMIRSSLNKKTQLILTNKGYCLGGDIGMENGSYHFMLDGCLLIGSGGVSAYGDPDITYEQSLPALGFKIGPSASMIVSSSKSRIGIALPLIYTSQTLTQPEDPDFKIKEKSSISPLATIYSRWQFGDWYIRTEFGQYFSTQESFWGFGFGKKF